MSDWKSLFPFVGKRTVAQQLDRMFDRQSVVSALFGATVGGFVTTVVTLAAPNLVSALIIWAALLLFVPVLSIYWGILQKKWSEVTED